MNVEPPSSENPHLHFKLLRLTGFTYRWLCMGQNKASKVPLAGYPSVLPLRHFVFSALLGFNGDNK